MELSEPVASPWMRAEGAATYLGLALGTVRNMTSERRIPHAKRGGIVRYHRDRLDEWLGRGGCAGRTRRADG